MKRKIFLFSEKSGKFQDEFLTSYIEDVIIIFSSIFHYCYHHVVFLKDLSLWGSWISCLLWELTFALNYHEVDYWGFSWRVYPEVFYEQPSLIWYWQHLWYLYEKVRFKCLRVQSLEIELIKGFWALGQP